MNGAFRILCETLTSLLFDSANDGWLYGSQVREGKRKKKFYLNDAENGSRTMLAGPLYTRT